MPKPGHEQPAKSFRGAGDIVWTQPSKEEQGLYAPGQLEKLRDEASAIIQLFMDAGGVPQNLISISGVAAHIATRFKFGEVEVHYQPFGGLYNPAGPFFIPVPQNEAELAEHVAMARQYQQAAGFFEARDIRNNIPQL